MSEQRKSGPDALTDESISLEKLLLRLRELGDTPSDSPHNNESQQHNEDDEKSADKETGGSIVTVGDIIHVVGDRSFAPLLMLVGMLLFSPLSGIPILPTMLAAIVLVVTLQMLFGRKHFWLPAKLLRAHVSGKKLNIAVKWLGPPARFIDRITMPRLTVLVRGPSVYVIGVICLSIACLMPLMELILFSSSLAGAVLMTFGVALVSRDGLLALLGYSTTALAVWLIVRAVSSAG